MGEVDRRELDRTEEQRRYRGPEKRASFGRVFHAAEQSGDFCPEGDHYPRPCDGELLLDPPHRLGRELLEAFTFVSDRSGDAELGVLVSMPFFEQEDFHDVRDPAVASADAQGLEVQELQLVGRLLRADAVAVEVALGLERPEVVTHGDVVLSTDRLEPGGWIGAQNEGAPDGGVERHDGAQPSPAVVVRVLIQADVDRVLAKNRLLEHAGRAHDALAFASGAFASGARTDFPTRIT